MIAPVVSSSSSADSSKARLAAFDAAIIWLAQKALEHGANLVLGMSCIFVICKFILKYSFRKYKKKAATFEEVVSESVTTASSISKRRKMEIIGTGTAVRVLSSKKQI